MYKDVVVRIDYVSNDNLVTQRGTFPLKGRTPEKVAYDFWREIKRHMPFDCQLEKVIIDGEEQTEKVLELEANRYNQ